MKIYNKIHALDSILRLLSEDILNECDEESPVLGLNVKSGLIEAALVVNESIHSDVCDLTEEDYFVHNVVKYPNAQAH